MYTLEIGKPPQQGYSLSLPVLVRLLNPLKGSLLVACPGVGTCHCQGFVVLRAGHFFVLQSPFKTSLPVASRPAGLISPQKTFGLRFGLLDAGAEQQCASLPFTDGILKPFGILQKA